MACSFESLDMELKITSSFVSCYPRSVSHTDTLHHPHKTGKKAGEMTHHIWTFCTCQGVFI